MNIKKAIVKCSMKKMIKIKLCDFYIMERNEMVKKNEVYPQGFKF